MNYIFLVNPKSGKGRGYIVSKIIEDYCNKLNVNYKILYTNKSLDAIKLAEAFKNSNSCIYSVGGDGTINEVINGLAYGNSSLSIIPAGSGNDFYKAFKNNKAEVIDLGSINNKYFVNIASFGLDAMVAKDANELKKFNIPSNLLYIASLGKNFLGFDKVELNINELKKNITMLTICNGNYYGGGFHIAPNAKLNDGLFDIYEVNKASKFQTLKMLCQLLKTQHDKSKLVSYYKTDSISISSDIPLVCNVDGEIITNNKFLFKVHKKALKLKVKDELKINELLLQKKIIR